MAAKRLLVIITKKLKVKSTLNNLSVLLILLLQEEFLSMHLRNLVAVGDIYSGLENKTQENQTNASLKQKRPRFYFAKLLVILLVHFISF